MCARSRKKPTDEEYALLMENLEKRGKQVDYILTHKYETGKGTQTPRLRELAEYIDGNIDFKMWYAGHWHRDAKLGERQETGLPSPRNRQTMAMTVTASICLWSGCSPNPDALIW